MTASRDQAVGGLLERATTPAARAARTDLVVVVLQWGNADETLRCLEALRRTRGVDFAVIVVDNGTPDAAARVRGKHRWVQVVENGANLGFAEGNNVILRQLLAQREQTGAPRYCLLLNNDVEVEPDCLARLLETARAPRAGAVGALNLVRRSEEIGSSGGFVAWPSARYRDAGVEARALGRTFEVETIAGSTLLLDLAALAVVGLLDPAYFCVYEETDLCLRLKQAGFRLWLCPEARAWHAVGASTPRRLHLYFRLRNRFRLARRFGGRHAVPRLLPSLAAELLWRVPVYVLTGRWRDVVGLLRGAYDGLRGVVGPGPLVPDQPPATDQGRSRA